MTLNDKQMRTLASIATIAAVCMYVSYIPQIQMNLAGQQGSAIQPLAAAINCLLWIGYGALRKQKDWAIIIANIPGVILGVVACVTAL